MSGPVQKTVDSIAAPVLSAGGVMLAVEGWTQGLNLMAAILGVIAACLGIYWSYLRIKIAKKQLKDTEKDG